MRPEEFKYDYDLGSLQAITPKNRNFKMLITPRYLHHYVKNSFEDFTADLLLHYSKENMLFIDIGAHYGFYSLLVATQHKKSKILAFEPTPENYEVLKRNVALNKLQNVDVYNLAVSNHDEIKKFNITEASDSCGFYPHCQTKNLTMKKVQAVTLDKILKDKSKVPTIIKIDTEGHEICVLEGMRSILKNTKEIKLIVEFNPKMLGAAGFEPEHLLEKLHELGFDAYLIDDQQRETYKLDQTNINSWGGYVGRESYMNILCTKKEKSLSVCFFSHSSHLAGSERGLLELVTELISDHGVICSVILPDNGPLRKKLEEVGASAITAKYDWWCDSSLLPNEEIVQRLNNNFKVILGEIKKKVDKINPDVILTNTMVIPWGAVTASILNKPHVWFVHEYGEFDYHFKFYLPFQDILKIIKDSSNIIITNSNSVRKELFGKTAGPNILTISYHIAIPPTALYEDKNDYFTKTDATKLIIAGNIYEFKGQEDAILAVRELVKREKDVELIIVGYSITDYLEKLRELVTNENLEEYVRFIGFKENVYPVINQADIVLVCSKKEAFGRVTLEAMLLRKPVVGTNSGGTAELIKEGFNGLLYEPGDYSQLADKIEYLIEHKDKIREFGENGNKYVKGRFTKEECWGRVYKILMEVKNTKNPSLTSYWQFVVSNMLHALSNLEAPQLSHLEGLGREQAAVLNNIYNSYAWKTMVIYYKIRDKLFPENTKRRLFAKIIFNAPRKPKTIIKNLNATNLKKFIHYIRISEHMVLEEKIRRKIGSDKGAIGKEQSQYRENTAGYYENDAEKGGGLSLRLRDDYSESPPETHVQEGKNYVPSSCPNIPEVNIKLIAFYLPQFHPIPENDRFWGRGFTDWVNVAKAIPNFKGHYQPHIPADLGFYDLRLPEVGELQAEMARQYGIYGFCYHHYWFNGRRLLERPFNEVLRSGKPDFPFCLCWANENWTRRWDGAEHDILIAQEYSKEDDIAFIRDIIPALRDDRYIRINGKPLLLVYRVNLLPNPKKTAEIWRRECKTGGIGDIYLCAAQSFDITNPRPYGFDAAVEFPPHGIVLSEINERLQITNHNFRGNIYNYRDVVDYMKKKKAPPFTLFRTVMPSWDNTPRRLNDGHIFANATPDLYREWLTGILEYTDKHLLGEERLVFINSWNEWAEGAHLEPDRKYGYAYLQATTDAILSSSFLGTPTYTVKNEITPHNRRTISGVNMSKPGTFRELVMNMTDEVYLKLILKSIKHPYIRGIKMPGFPNEEIQKHFVGSTKRQALLEGYNFYLVVKEYCEFLDVSFNSNIRLLDFGCGWGRIARFFFKDTSSENFYGVDVDTEIIDFCKGAMGHGIYLTTTPMPPTTFEENAFDIIYAFSVFSHLAEPVARKWIEEFASILRPGGVLLATTQRRDFLDYCESLRANKSSLESEWHKGLAESFIHIDQAKRDYDEGKFLYSPTGGGGIRDASFYGEALIPKGYIEREYGRFLVLRDFLDDPYRLPQALFVMQKYSAANTNNTK